MKMSLFNCFTGGSTKKKAKCSCSGCKKGKKNLKHSKSFRMDQLDGGGISCGRRPRVHASEISSQRMTETISEASNNIYETELPGIAYLPVARDSAFYNMNHENRGLALIFNFDKWENGKFIHEPREGSQKDKNDLEKCLKNVGFSTEVYDNVKMDAWSDIMREVEQMDHTHNDCLLIAIMTHGQYNKIVLSDGTLLPVNLIWERFEANRCPSLAGKPKIFIIQACRGEKYDSGTTLNPNFRQTHNDSYNEATNDVTDSGVFSYVIPNAADLFICFSSPLGHFSWRNRQEGSWFIQSICNVLNSKIYELDLQSLFTEIAREVALKYESKTDHPSTNKKKQVTSTTSTLIRYVQFTQKRVPNSIMLNDFDNDHMRHMSNHQL